MPFVPNVPGVPPLSSFLTEPISLLTVDSALALIQGSQLLQWGIYDQFGVPVIASTLTPLFGLGSLTSVINTLNSVSALLVGQQLVNQFSVVDFEYKQDWNISSAPTEQGGFQSYNKVQLPFDVRMRIAAGGDQTNRTSLLTIVNNLANAGLPAGQPISIPGLSAAASSTISNILSAPSLVSGIFSAILGTSSAIPLFNVLTPEKVYLNCSVSHYDYRRTAINGLGVLIVDIWLSQIRQTSTSSFINTQSPTAAGQTALGNIQPGPSIPPVVSQ